MSSRIFFLATLILGLALPATLSALAPQTHHNRVFTGLSGSPERFREEGRSAQHRFAYIPFGGGPRVCIGRNFALMEVQLVVSSVLQRFRIEPQHDHPIRANRQGSEGATVPTPEVV